MADYGYVTPYRGMGGPPLPAGYLEAATAPGRAIGAGIAKAGDRIWGAIQQYKDDKESGDFYRQQIADMAGTIHGIANNGNLTDPRTPESQLIAHAMRSFGVDTPDKLIDVAAKSATLSHGSARAKAGDMAFMLHRYDTLNQQGQDNARADAQGRRDEIQTQILKEHLAQLKKDAADDSTLGGIMGRFSPTTTTTTPVTRPVTVMPSQSQRGTG